MHTSYRTLGPLLFGVLLMISSAHPDEDQEQNVHQEATSPSSASADVRTATFGLG